jgi:hypothetical protein
MKIAYLILVHNNPRHFKKLIYTLATEDCAFFIHVDKKVELDDFFINLKNVHYLRDRVNVSWGRYSIVDATVKLMREAVKYCDQFDYFILLSGVDYPLQSNQYITDFFSDHSGCEFMNIVQMPSKVAGKPISRLTGFYISVDDPVYKKLLFKLTTLLRKPIMRNYQSVFNELLPYGGSQWWALSMQACTYILDFIDKHRRFVDFHKNSANTCESFFQTILGNSPFSTKLIPSLTYTDWSAGGPHPAIIYSDHLSLFRSTDKVIVSNHYGTTEVLFARKFSDENIELLSEFDNMILSKEINREKIEQRGFDLGTSL